MKRKCHNHLLTFINKVLAGADISGEVHICGKKLQNTKILNFTRLSNYMVYKKKQ
jgi:hypothetical protein